MIPILAALLGLTVAIALAMVLNDGEDAPPAPAITTARFTEATETAGLRYVQHQTREPGDCLFDNISQTQASAREGMLCDPERMSGGAAAGDFDGDGAIDLVATRLDGHPLLFRNRGDGSFRDVSRRSGLADWEIAANGAAWGDIDNDGDLDLYLTTVGDTRHYLFLNDGAGRFQEAARERGVDLDTGDRRIGFSAVFGDYDLDGYLDLHVTEWRPSELIGEAAVGVRLLRNRGAEAPGYFDDVTERAGVSMAGVVSQTQTDLRHGSFAFASTFVDLDRDGWPDLAVASDFGTSRLFWNNGDGTFTDGTLHARVGTDQNGMGSTFGDYDLDGDLDWFVTSVYSVRLGSPGTATQGLRDGNRLYRNDGDRLFADATDEAGVRNGDWGWGAAFFDADNDGDLDLTMTNGMEMLAPYRGTSMRYWENDGAGGFVGRGSEAGLSDTGDGKGLLVFDADNDGDQDLFVVNNGSQPLLLRNRSQGGNWLKLSLEGVRSNRDGIGAQVTVEASGLAAQVREAGVGGHFLGQSDASLHFGLGAAQTATVQVYWPASGIVTTLRDVPANRWIAVREGDADWRDAGP